LLPNPEVVMAAHMPLYVTEEISPFLVFSYP